MTRPARLKAAAAALAATLAVSLPLANGSIGPEQRPGLASAARFLNANARPARIQTRGVQAALLLARRVESFAAGELAPVFPSLRSGAFFRPLFDRESLLALPPPVL